MVQTISYKKKCVLANNLYIKTYYSKPRCPEYLSRIKNYSICLTDGSLHRVWNHKSRYLRHNLSQQVSGICSCKPILGEINPTDSVNKHGTSQTAENYRPIVFLSQERKCAARSRTRDRIFTTILRLVTIARYDCSQCAHQSRFLRSLIFAGAENSRWHIDWWEDIDGGFAEFSVLDEFLLICSRSWANLQEFYSFGRGFTKLITKVSIMFENIKHGIY